MNKKATTLLFMFLLLFINLSAQENSNREAFISINSGGYISLGKDFRKTYSDMIFINGLSLGIPISNKELFIYGKGMHFQKEGTPIVYHFTSENGIANNYTTQEGKIKINHFLINVGLQYNIELQSDWTIITNGGLTFVNSREKSIDPNKLDSSSKGLSGYFLGVGIEKNLSKFPVNLFSEFQYNTGRVVLKLYGIDYASLNINVGIRYYFKE